MAQVESWKPRTKLGMLVSEGKISSIDEIFQNNYKIQEPEIVDMLIPNLKAQVLYSMIVQKQTAAGELTRFKSLVVVGDGNGHIGIGVGKSKQTRIAIDKATIQAKLNLIPVPRGCGSWECSCGRPHSIPHRAIGKCGSVTVELKPGPYGLGLVVGEFVKPIFTLAGISDVWSFSRGNTSNRVNFAFAVYEAFKNIYKLNIF
ncbi:MAG TPA: 30S ribosomal protein S5 [Geobacterales bacterium]|nr:30S ribosomal protein S5 [Geobacterales bacterium]